jgi:hypothetical protein
VKIKSLELVDELELLREIQMVRKFGIRCRRLNACLFTDYDIKRQGGQGNTVPMAGAIYVLTTYSQNILTVSPDPVI